MRRICIFTSTRADWGLLRGVAEEIRAHSELELQLLVSGSHLSAKFGMTVSEIEEAGFDITAKVDVLQVDDSSLGICRVMGVALPRYSEALDAMNPDLLIVLGDRYETLCVAVAAHVLQIPLAHIHGGETTEGAIDESFRHSITKMSQLHFTACEAYRQRVLQLGEQPERVFNVGALGVENIRKLSLMNRETLAASIGFPFDLPFFLVTFHPVTLEHSTAGDQVDELFAALSQFPEYRVIFTKANADTDGVMVNTKIDAYTSEFPDRCLAVSSLGLVRYLSAMKICAAVVGNSSSGILEAPSLRVPTVNIGDRQKGRVRAPSVVDCEPERVSIQGAIESVLDAGFRKSLEGMSSPFEQYGTAARIVEVIASFELEGVIKKSFYDLTKASFD